MEEEALPKPVYEYVTTEERTRSVLSEISKHDSIEVDTEATGLDPYTSKISLLQIGVPGKAYVFDVRHDTEHSSVHLDLFKPLLTNKRVLKLLQNAVFDMKLIKLQGGYYIENIYDTMLVEQLFNLGINVRGASLEDLVRKYLGLSMNKQPRNTFENYHQKFEPYQIEYAAGDVAILTLLKDLQEPRLKKERFKNVARLEFEFTKAMCEMELNGITLDVDKWRIMMKKSEGEYIEIGKKLQSQLSVGYGQNVMFGVPIVNVDSPVQLLKSLRSQGINIDNTNAKTLNRFKGVELIDTLLNYRKLSKLLSTYGESLIEKINPVSGRLHTRFQQMVSTGRMSSSDPNLQNIPKKQRFRSCFIAKPGYSLVTADMSGAELRILGNLSEDAIFLDCYARGIDLHTRTASEIFEVPMEEIKSDRRGQAKAINFGLCIIEDTELITNFGIKAIKNVEIGNIVAHDIGSNKIIDKKYMGEKEVFEVKTKFGYSIEVTADHLMKVVDKEGRYVDKKLSDIVIGKDQMCLKLGAKMFPSELYKFKPFIYPCRTNAKNFSVPTELTTEWASFIGLLISEGHLHKDGSGKYNSVQFGMSIKDIEFIDYIDDLFNKLFGTYGKSCDSNIVSYSIASVKLAHWLVSILSFEEGNKTNTIDVPTCVKESPKEIQISFLKTLFEGDGTIFKSDTTFGISYSSKSFTLVKSIQLILLNLGILSKLRSTPDKRYPIRDYYKLDILDTECKLLFMSEIGFITSRKNYKAITNKTFKRSIYNLNISNEKLVALQKTVSISRKEVKNGNIDTCNWYLYNNLNIYKRNYIGNAYFKVLSSYDETIKFINDNNIVTLPITSIESKGIKRVYDISVKDHQYFIANGFIVHNCYGLSKYGLAERLKISENASEDMINKYFDRYSGVKKYLDKSASDAIKKGYTTTVSGRKRFYNIPPFGHPDRKKIQRSVERAAKNAGIQGANADTVKEAMILIVDRLAKSGLDAKLLLTVHDEVVIEARDGHRKEVAHIVSQSLIDGFGKYFNKIPMETDALSGPCWLKGSCENEPAGDGKSCGCCEMVFVADEQYGTKLVCSKCGCPQE